MATIFTRTWTSRGATGRRVRHAMYGYDAMIDGKRERRSSAAWQTEADAMEALTQRLKATAAGQSSARPIRRSAKSLRRSGSPIDLLPQERGAFGLVMGGSSVQPRGLYEKRPLCLQRLPEAGVRIATQVVGLGGGRRVTWHLPNVPEGRRVGSPAVYAVILPLSHRQFL